MFDKELSLAFIEDAAQFLEGKILKTPVEFSEELSSILRVPVYLKLEFLQRTGSFKPRGSLYKLSFLKPEEKERGVVTCSAGNHGKALSYAAAQLNLKVTVFVTAQVDSAKLEAIIRNGAEVIHSPFISFDETEELAKQHAKETKRTFISAFDDEAIMAGNGGTLAKEILQQIPEAKTFVLPVGGGGLAAGFSYYVKEKQKDAQIIACQHESSAALKLSLEKGYAVTKMPGIETTAGGIEGGLGEKCFPYLKTRIDDVLLVSEEEILNAFSWVAKTHQLLIEPTAAAALAPVLAGKVKAKYPTAIILTGRNVAVSTIKRHLV